MRSRYFAARFFGSRFFGGAVEAGGSYFGANYFASRYLAARYFREGIVGEVPEQPEVPVIPAVLVRPFRGRPRPPEILPLPTPLYAIAFTGQGGQSVAAIFDISLDAVGRTINYPTATLAEIEFLLDAVVAGTSPTQSVKSDARMRMSANIRTMQRDPSLMAEASMIICARAMSGGEAPMEPMYIGEELPGFQIETFGTS